MSEYRFLHFSDLHFKQHAAREGLEHLLTHVFHPLQNIAESLRAEPEPPDFILLTGDLAHEGDEEEYRALRQSLEDICRGIPVIAMPGNHDRRPAYWKAYCETEPQPNGWVHWVGGLRIVALDSGGGLQGEITDAQAEWLRGVLAGPAADGTLLALHHPLLPGQDGAEEARLSPGFPQLVAESDIRGIFCGHTHRNCIGRFAGKPYVTADSIAFTWNVRGGTARCENHAGYVWGRLRGGELTVQIKQAVPPVESVACFPIDQP